ncbi:MAG: hypothetical protein R3E39_21105 [Anaerolineae bacterium]
MIRMSAMLGIVIVALCLCAVALGRGQQSSHALNGFDVDCNAVDIPCWQGLVPGVTTISATRLTVEALGYEPNLTGIELADHVFSYQMIGHNPACFDLYYWPENRILKSISLRCLDLTIGDMMAVADAPRWGWKTKGFGEMLYFPGRYTAAVNQNLFMLSPFTTIDAVYIETGLTNSPDPLLALEWMGFAPRWRYCLIEAIHPLCLNYQ